MNSLVIFSGLPGTGKSTLAWRLAHHLQWPLLCIDDVLGEIPLQPTVRFWDAKVAILLGVVERQLELSLNVIVDSVFMDRDRLHAQALASNHQARFRPIHTFMSDEALWEQRVTARFAALNNPDVATWERIQQQRTHFRPWEPSTALFVDNAQPLEQNFTDVLRFATTADLLLQPLPDLPWSIADYH